MKNKCNCHIGDISGHSLFISNVKDEIERTSQMQKIFKANGLLNNKEPLTTLQIIDNRKGYVSRFSFCPYCGTKINWKTIVNNFR